MKHTKGFATALVLMTLTVIIMLGFALVSRGIGQLGSSLRTRELTYAYYAGESGIALSLSSAEADDPNLPTGCGQTGTPASLQGQSNPQVLSDNSKFQITVTNNYGTTCLADQTAPDGTAIPPGMAYFTSVGTDAGAQKTIHVLGLIVKGWNFPDAAFGKTGVTLNGNSYTDSYNSNNGPYGGINANLGNGNVGTNADTAGAVSLNGNADVKGAATVGPGGSAGYPTISVSGNAVYNSAAVLQSQIPMPAVTDPLGGYGTSAPSGGILSPGQFGNVTVSGSNTITLTCGTYSFQGLTITGKAQLIIDPNCTASNPVKIYVYDTLQLTGNGVENVGDISTRFLVYGMPSLTSASVTGNGTTALALYAPSADIQVSGNGDVYGSVVGNTVTIGGNNNEHTSLHYDEALTNDQFVGSTKFTVKSWSAQ